MIRWVGIAFAFLISGAIALAQSIPFPGPGMVASGGYTGPGDAVSGAKGMWGLRGYNAAFSGAVATVCDSATGLTCASATWSGSTLTLPTIGGFACDNASHKCVITKLVDQTGNGQDFDQGILAGMPLLVVNCVASTKPCLQFDGTGNAMFATGGSSTTDWTISEVWNCTSGAVEKPVFKDGNFYGSQCRGDGSDNYEIYAGSAIDASETPGAWHTFAGATGTGSTGKAVVDTTTTPGDTGGGAFDTGWQLGVDPGFELFLGKWTETVFYPSSLSAGNITALHNNQCAYYGTTC